MQSFWQKGKRRQNTVHFFERIGQSFAMGCPNNEKRLHMVLRCGRANEKERFHL